MSRLSALAPFAAILLLSALPDAAAQPAIHDTGQVRLQVFNNGSVGAQAGVGAGFTLFGEPVLFDGQFYVGTSGDRLSGEAYTGADWRPGTPVGAPFGNGSFNQSRRATFTDQNAPSPLGVEIVQRSFSSGLAVLQKLVLLEYTVRNTTAQPLQGVYTGLFADFDLDDTVYAQNLGSFDAALDLVYTFPSDGTGPFAGVVLLDNAPRSGWSVSAIGPGTGTRDQRVFTAMTTTGQTPSAPGDRTTVLGAGPYDIPPGGSIRVYYAFVAGTSLADLRATAATARGLFPDRLQRQVLDTGSAALRVFNTGYFGAELGTPADSTFAFGMASPLYEGQLIVGISPTQVSGRPFSTNLFGPTPGQRDWTSGAPLEAVSPPAPFTQAWETTYTDAGGSNTDPAGLSVRQRALARDGDDFVVVEAAVASATSRPGVYVGMFADFDVTPGSGNDLGGFDAATGTVYTYSTAPGALPGYYGVTLIRRPVSGWSVDASAGTGSGTTPGLYLNLTTPGATPTTAGDRRMLLGAGPLSLEAGVPQTVRFAYVGGSDLPDLLTNAAAAQALFSVASTANPDVPGMSLLPPIPNPAGTTARVAFSLDAPGDARLTVHDVLGREVAVGASGPMEAGAHSVSVDVTRLAAGVYVVRLTTAHATAVRVLTVAR